MKNSIEVKELDTVAYQTIKQQMVPGFLQMTVDVEGNILYQTQGLITLQEYLKKDLDAFERLTVLQQLSLSLLCTKQFSFMQENINLDLEDIFVDVENGKIYITYFPSKIPQTSTPFLQRLDTLCGKILSPQEKKIVEPLKLQEEADYAQTTLFVEDDVETHKTMCFENLQSAAEESKLRKARKKQGIYSGELRFPTLVRLSNGERIDVKGNIFKIGKDGDYVDYCIEDNPAVSKSHADILKRGNEYYFMDNYSLNGSKIDGEIVVPGKMMLLSKNVELTLANEQFLLILNN